MSAVSCGLVVRRSSRQDLVGVGSSNITQTNIDPFLVKVSSFRFLYS